MAHPQVVVERRMDANGTREVGTRYGRPLETLETKLKQTNRGTGNML
jgi:hypothetical protein